MARGNTGKYIGAGLIGAALGAIAGVLFAPKSGKETRRTIARGARRAERKAVGTVRQATKRLRRR